MHSPRAIDKMTKSEALHLWHKVNLGSVLDAQADLTSRQTALLMCVYLEEGPHTVRSLAIRLHVTKAVITRALNTLGGYGFITRGVDLRDKRSVLIKRTGIGSRYLSEFADRMRQEARLLTSAHLSTTSQVA